jgi:hypothetical protein
MAYLGQLHLIIAILVLIGMGLYINYKMEQSNHFSDELFK